MENTRKDIIKACIEEVVGIAGIGASVCHIWYGFKINVFKILTIDMLDTAAILSICLISHGLYKKYILD